MRSDEDLRQELPGAGEDAGEQADPPPENWTPGPQTAAERVAARRRLDRLAEEH